MYCTACLGSLIPFIFFFILQLEAYAKEQGKLGDWDGTGRGYTWEYEYLSKWFWLFLTGDIFLSLFSIALAPQIYLTIKNVAANKFQVQDQETPQQSNDASLEAQPEITRVPPADGGKSSPSKTFKADNVLYVFALVLLVICLLEFACSIYVTVRAAAICPTQSCRIEVIPTRVIILCLVAAIGIIGSLIFRFVSDKTPQQKSLLEKINDKEQKSSKEKFKLRLNYFFISAREYFTIAGFFAVFVLLAVNVIPTIILGFIFPFEVITGIVYLPIIGIVVLLYTEVSSYIISEWEAKIIQAKEKRMHKPILSKDQKLILYWLFNIIVIILFVSAATVIFVFSFTVHQAEVQPSFVSTLVPPIILFLLTTLAKKYVIDKYDPPQTVNIIECSAKALPVHNTDALPTAYAEDHQALIS